MLDLLICDNCGILTYQVYVHGHYQCSDCKVVSDPCCSGEHAYLSNSARDSGVKVNDQKNIKKDNPALSQKQKEQRRGYLNDQENIKRVKERVDRWSEETQNA